MRSFRDKTDKRLLKEKLVTDWLLLHLSKENRVNLTDNSNFMILAALIVLFMLFIWPRGWKGLALICLSALGGIFPIFDVLTLAFTIYLLFGTPEKPVINVSSSTT